MSDRVRPPAHAAVRALLDDPVDLQRTRASVLGAMFGEPDEPTMVGRFEIVATAGRGAMGRVYVAFDPELDRTVALKLIVDDGDPRTAEERRGRLVGEAQAMAQLTHANVISVFEVGRHAGDVFIVMQYVPGPNLRRWTAAPGRTRDERLASLIGAARGLAAAHAAGLVHRDFKPDNVIVDERGHAFVTDFGLARSLDTNPPGSCGSATASGGTPAYMAPEQVEGGGGREASDQFAFCVSAWEVLCGTRPPRRGATQEVVPGDDAALPKWLRRVLTRGMATRPEDRWPTMDALVAALTRESARRRGTVAVAGVSIAAFALAGWIATDEPDPCLDAGDPIAEQWNDERREALSTALSSTGIGYSAAASQHAIGKLDAYRDAWTDAAQRTCEMSHESLRSDAMIDRGHLCLTDARSRVRAAVNVLVDADADVVRHSTALVGGLPELDACLDADALMAAVSPPPAALVDAVEDQKDRLADVSAALNAGRESIAEKASAEVLAASETIGYTPLRAEALMTRAHVLDRANESARARELFLDAYFLAGSIDFDKVAAQSAVEMVSLFGSSETELAEARQWYRHAAMAVARSPATRRYLTRATRYLAWAEMMAGNLERAREVGEQALAEAIELDGADSEDAAHADGILAIVAMERGDEDEALKRYRAALELLERHLPPGHPTLARMLNNAGIVARQAGEYDLAAEFLQRSLRIKIDLYGEQHTAVANVYNSLGLLESARGHFDAAREDLEHALEIRHALLPPTHVDTLEAQMNLVNVAVRARHYARAIELATRTLEIHRGAGHPAVELVPGMINLAWALVGEHRWDEALARARQAYDMIEEERPRSPLVPAAMVVRAAALDGLQRPDEALRLLDDAGAFDGEGTLDPDSEARRWLELAYAQQQLGASTDEVRRLSEGARQRASAPGAVAIRALADELIDGLR